MEEAGRHIPSLRASILAGEEKSELDAGERSKPADRETPARAGDGEDG